MRDNDSSGNGTGRFLVVVILGAVCSACSGSLATSPSAGRKNAVAADTLVVTRGPFVERFLVTGELEAVRSTYLSVPRVPTWETSIRWMEADGAAVKAGQKVIEFDNSSFTRDLEEKRLQRTQALADLEKKEAEIASQVAEKEFQVESRRIALDKAEREAAIPEELLSRREYQDKRLALERARIEHQKALEDLEAARRANEEEVEQRKIALDRTQREIELAQTAIQALVLAAPRDGIFVVGDHWQGRKLQIGDTVWVGMPIASLPELDAMRVGIDLSDVDDGKILTGMTAVCTLDTYPERTFRGRVSGINAVAQEAEGRSLRRAFSGIVDLDEVDAERMRPGMSVKVEVEAARTDGVLLVPRAALDLSGARPKAFLARGGEIEVTLGMCNAVACVVESGLSEGDRLRARG